MKKLIDLHSHTIYSDGSSTVSELLLEAERLGLKKLSITDHNTVDAYEELKDLNIRNLYSGEIINGIELTTTYNGEVIEILGYNIDIDKMKKLLSGNVLTFEQKQLKEYELIRNQYISIGIKMNLDNINFNPKIESSRIAYCKEIKKHSENNKFFLNEESLTSEKGFTRNEVYNPKSHLYVNQSSLYVNLEKAIDMIHECGGFAFLAHTFAYSPTILENLVNIIINYELDGLECYYTTFTDEQIEYLLKICEEYKLYKSGGSDFHGTRKINHNLGTGHSNLRIEEDLINDWLDSNWDYSV